MIRGQIMMRSSVLVLLAVAFGPATLAADEPPTAQAFQVFDNTMPMGPRITPYLQYQTEQAWNQEDKRRVAWGAIRDEQELLRAQAELRKKLLQMIGGLPAEKKDLHARITGTIQM